jgi:hypothetical protein
LGAGHGIRGDQEELVEGTGANVQEGEIRQIKEKEKKYWEFITNSGDSLIIFSDFFNIHYRIYKCII